MNSLFESNKIIEMFIDITKHNNKNFLTDMNQKITQIKNSKLKNLYFNNEEIILEESDININYDNDSFRYIITFNNINNSNDLQNNFILVDEFMIYLKRLFLLNLHLNFNLFLNHDNNSNLSNLVKVVDLSSFTLSIPKIDDMIEYLEKEFNCLIPEENYFSFNKNILKKYDLELLFIFHNFNGDIKENYLDLSFANNRIYNKVYSERILKNDSFRKILNEMFNIKFVNDDNINRVQIKSENEKSLFIYFNISTLNYNYNIEEKDFEKEIINEFLNLVQYSVKSIKEKNTLLLLDEKERKILKIYERDMNIISRSIIQIMSNVLYYFN
jgi:hypothetical protein